MEINPQVSLQVVYIFSLATILTLKGEWPGVLCIPKFGSLDYGPDLFMWVFVFISEIEYYACLPRTKSH